MPAMPKITPDMEVIDLYARYHGDEIAEPVRRRALCSLVPMPASMPTSTPAGRR